MIVGLKDLKRQLFLRVFKKRPIALVTCLACDLIYMPCSTPVPPTMAVRELDLQTV